MTADSIEARRKGWVISHYIDQVIAPSAKTPQAAMAAKATWFADALQRHDVKLANADIEVAELPTALGIAIRTQLTPTQP